MNNVLVAYFSCSGVTEGVAKDIAEIIRGKLYEIEPTEPYTKEDLNWLDKKSRSSVEMNDSTSRPKIKGLVDNMDSYDTVFLGFPIWWYVAPTIINTFLESYDFSNKRIILFYTSGGSGLGETLEKLKGSCNESVQWNKGKLLNDIQKAELENWLQSL